ncbi:MAG: hypothetical protein ACOYYS_11955 [Chloroflexota bacterium]
MRRGRIFIYLALLLIIVVGAAFFLLPKLTGDSGNGGIGPGPDVVPTATPVTTVEVIVVSQPIPLGAEITADYLMTLPISQDVYVPDMYMTDMSKAVGRLARYDLQQGIWLNEKYLVESLEQVSSAVSDISFLIDKGKVAVSIPITRLSSVSYAPQRGDHVNVIVTLMLVDTDSEFQSELPNYTAGVLAPGPSLLLGTDDTSSLQSSEQLRSIAAQVAGGGEAAKLGRSFQDPTLEQTFYLVPSEAQRPRMVSQTLIQDVKVLQVGTYVVQDRTLKPVQEVAETPTPAPGQEQPQPTPEPEKPDLITIVVSPQDAVTLNYLLFAGAQVTLALRPVGDVETVETQAVTLNFLMENYRIQRPEKMDISISPRVDELTQPNLPNDKLSGTPVP